MLKSTGYLLCIPVGYHLAIRGKLALISPHVSSQVSYPIQYHSVSSSCPDDLSATSVEVVVVERADISSLAFSTHSRCRQTLTFG